jgi:transcriptional regulator with XRE-family HTH domain
MKNSSKKPGEMLRANREALGMSLRDVESASVRLAKLQDNDEFQLTISRLSEIENKGTAPSIFKLHALAMIYRKKTSELLRWYGIDLEQTAASVGLPPTPVTRGLTHSTPNDSVNMPVRLDPSFDLKRTANLGRVVEKWGIVPLTFLERFMNRRYAYGYIGTQDFTMYPLLMPGSFVQVDEEQREVMSGMWRSELERPIYWVETRQGIFCCWCVVRNAEITLQPHPLSPEPVRVFKYPAEVDVVGRVVGVAMRLDEIDPDSTTASARTRHHLS